MAKTREYHLIDLACGVSHGGFATLAGARQFAREEMLDAWEVWLGNERIERHYPISEHLPDETGYHRSMNSDEREHRGRQPDQHGDGDQHVSDLFA